jgi:predicted site-specific integrase-resolvase
MSPRLHRKADAAAQLGISIRQLEEYVKRGEIAVLRLAPKCIRIEDEELTRFVQRERERVAS